MILMGAKAFVVFEPSMSLDVIYNFWFVPGVLLSFPFKKTFVFKKIYDSTVFQS
jgi:hypothetical protein